MTARLTQQKAGEANDFAEYPVYTGVTLQVGHLVMLNSSGYAVPVTAATGLKCAGVCDSQCRGAIPASLGQIVNGGASGSVWVRVKRGTFAFDNSSVTPLAMGKCGQLAFAESGYVVSEATATTSVAGIVDRYVAATDVGAEQQMGAAQVWVQVGMRAQPPTNYLTGYA